MSDLDDELEEAHFSLIGAYERSGPQPQMLMFLAGEDEAHAVMVFTMEAMSKVVRWGMSAWPNTSRVVLNGGEIPMTTLVTRSYSECVTSVPQTSWRGRLKGWEHRRVAADFLFVALVRQALADPKTDSSQALAEIENLEDAVMVPE